MKKLLLTLLSMPTMIGAMAPVLLHSPKAMAVELPSQKLGELCLKEHGKLYCVRQTKVDRTKVQAGRTIAKTPDMGVNFTDEESDAAIAMFGCDCPACIRSIKQIRAFTGTAS
jgi:hypothetical protein